MLLPSVVGLSIIIALSGLPRSFAAGQPSDVPAWLRAHVGEGEGQIAQVVLQRARALYLQKVSEGAVKNPCYFAMDATRPEGDGKLGRRFYVICETDRDVSRCFSGSRQRSRFERDREFRKRNTVREELQQCDEFQTDDRRGLCDEREEIAFFKGYYRGSAGKDAVLLRSFVQFDGEGDAANARQRAIGGHPAMLLRGVCLRKDPDSPYANHDGYVPFGKLVDYSGGRSNGCTSWSASDAGQIIPMMKDKPTTLYIYPKSDDIDAVALAVKAGRSPSRAGLYWNASCLKEIGSPKFWPKKPSSRSSFNIGRIIPHRRRARRRSARGSEICLCSLSLVRLFLVSWPLPRCLQLALSSGRSNFRNG